MAKARRTLGLATAVVVLQVLVTGHALAQAYPNKPIHWTIPYPPGGASDVTARVLARR